VIQRLPRRAAPVLARQVFSGGLVRRKGVRYHHDASHIEISAEAPFPVQVDGDYIGQRRELSIGLRPDALWLVA
jgi:diacylglycerol kinase family enzyme